MSFISQKNQERRQASLSGTVPGLPSNRGFMPSLTKTEFTLFLEINKGVE